MTSPAPIIARARPSQMGHLVPGPADLIAELQQIKELALNARRSWVDKRGEEQSYPQPDFKAAISAIRVQAEICGMIRNTPQFDTDTLVADAMRRALSDPELRKMLVEQIRVLEPGLLSDGKLSKTSK